MYPNLPTVTRTDVDLTLDLAPYGNLATIPGDTDTGVLLDPAISEDILSGRDLVYGTRRIWSVAREHATGRLWATFSGALGLHGAMRFSCVWLR